MTEGGIGETGETRLEEKKIEERGKQTEIQNIAKMMRSRFRANKGCII